MTSYSKLQRLQEVRVRDTDPTRPDVVVAGRTLVVATEEQRDDGIVWLFEPNGCPGLGIHQDWLEPTGRVVPPADGRIGLNRHICDGVAYMYSYHAASTGPIDVANNRYFLDYYSRYPRQDFLEALRWGIDNAGELYARNFEEEEAEQRRHLQEEDAKSPPRFHKFLITLLREIEELGESR